MPLSTWEQLLHGHPTSYAQAKSLVAQLGYDVDATPEGFSFNLPGHPEPIAVESSKNQMVENPGSTIAWAQAIARDEPKALRQVAGAEPSLSDAFEGFKQAARAYGTYKINKVQHRLTVDARNTETNTMKIYALPLNAQNMPESLADMDTFLGQLGGECITTARYQEQLDARLKEARAQKAPQSHFPVDAATYKAKLEEHVFTPQEMTLPDYTGFLKQQHEASKPAPSPSAYARCLSHTMLHHGLTPSMVARGSGGIVRPEQVQSWIEGKSLPNHAQFNATEASIMSTLVLPRGDDDITIDRLPGQLKKSWDEASDVSEKTRREPQTHPVLGMVNRILLTERPNTRPWTAKGIYVALANQGNNTAVASGSPPLEQDQVTNLLAGKDPHLTPYWQYQLYKFLTVVAMPQLRGQDELIEEAYKRDDFHHQYLKEFPTHKPTVKHPIPKEHGENEKDYADALSLQLRRKYFSAPGSDHPIALNALSEKLEATLAPYYGREVKTRVGKCCRSLFGHAASARHDDNLTLDAAYIEPALPVETRKAFLDDVEKLAVARHQYLGSQPGQGV